MTKDIKKIIFIILIIDAVLALFCLLYGGYLWLINSQMAFLISTLVTFSSFIYYKKAIIKKAEICQENYNDRDELDKIDDKYELFEEDESNSKQNENLDFKEVIKEEKRKQRDIKQNLSNLKTFLPSFLSPLKLIAYVLLVVSFLYLHRHNQLVIPAFLSGFFIVPLGSILFSFTQKQN